MLRILSLDVVIGSVIMSLLFARLFESNVSVWYYIVLGFAVWLIYTLDHLIDAKRIDYPASTKRHRFHQQYYKVLINIWYPLFLITLTIGLLFLPSRVVIGGLSLSVLILVHFIFVKVYGERVTVLIQKELMIALIYTGGVSVGPLLFLEESIDPTKVLVLIQVFVIALINLIEFSFFEYDTDKKDGHTSVARLLGRKHTIHLLKLMFLVIVLLSIIPLIDGRDFVFLTEMMVLLMSTCLGYIILKPKFFAQRERYRILGDGIFLFPLVLLF